MPDEWTAYTPLSDHVVQKRVWNPDTEQWEYAGSIVTPTPQRDARVLTQKQPRLDDYHDNE